LEARPLLPGRRPHQRRFDAATEIQVLLREDATLSSQAHNQPVGIGIYTPVRRVDPDNCRHDRTICRGCRRHWEEDHFLAIFTHATPNAYRNQGCRCARCRLASTDHDTAVRYPNRRPSTRRAAHPDATSTPLSGKQ
jgi:hypothetical protein